MKRNTMAYSVLLLVLMLCLSSCGITQGVNDSISAVQDSAQALPSQAISNVAALNSLSGFAVSSQGVYLSQQIRPASINLFYIDAQTKQELYLCSAPNCAHNSETCTSYVQLHDGEYDPQLFFHNDFLYLTRGPVNQEYAPSITRMNKDGSGRQVIVELEIGESFRGAVFGYGENILIDINKVEQNGLRSSWLEKINLQTGVREKLIEYTQDDEQSYFVMGTDDTRLIFIGLSEAGHKYFWVDPSSKQLSLTECYALNTLTEQFDNKNVFYTVQNQYLCKFDRLNNQLSYRNLATDEEKKFEVPALEDGDTLYGLEHLYDDKFALTLDDKNGVAVSALLDTATGSLTGVRISHTKDASNAIIASFGDDLIYRTRETEVLLQDQGELELINETSYFSVYAFASKDMFWSGKQGNEIPLPE